ncbi:MAG: KEOPS complex subunit Cgi121 [Haloarculaceae archaeon]
MRVVEGTATVEDVDAFVERLGEIGEAHDATVQAFDARYVVDRRHLERACELAGRAFDRGENVARERAVEILLYAAGRRQIERALTMGISEGECPAAIVVDGGDETGAADAAEKLLDAGETLGEYDAERVRDFFEISDDELAATDGGLAEIVHERVALLVVEK